MKMKLSQILFFLSFCLAGYTQDNSGIEIAKVEFKSKRVIPPSPDAAQLGKYGNVPVSLFTGTPNISIPFFQLAGNSLSLPISLSYHASGFKPEEIASWTGLGWSLNAGGVITRSVLGNPDIESNYFNADPFNKPAATDQIALANYYRAIREGTKETQPDVYYYNFNSHTGRFLIDPSGVVTMKERNMLAITNNSIGTNSSFTVKDEQGNTYTFTELEMTHSIPSDDIGEPAYNFYNYPSAWYLSSIVSADGVETIEFEYWSASGQNMYSNALQNMSGIYKLTNSACSYLNSQNASGERISSNQPSVTISRKFLKRLTLKRNGVTISYVDLESAVNSRQDLWLANFSGERLLQKVKLYSYLNSTATLVKQFDLAYGYFTGGANNSGEKRLRLESVKEVSVEVTAVDKPPFIFTYNDGDMPPRFTAGIDHWGFYNNQTNSINGLITLIPNVTSTNPSIPGTFGQGANRDPNFDGSSLTLINKITYPTGGYTKFEYELNKAISEGDNILRNIGGVRIKTIVDYASACEQANAKTYEYNLDDGSTSGKIGFWPRYDDYSVYTKYTPGCLGTTCGPGADPECFNSGSITMSISTSSIFGLGSVQGIHVGYTQVKEYQTDLTNNQHLGKTVYRYNIGVFSAHDDDVKNGDLSEQLVYDNGGKLQHHLSNTYSYSNTGIVNIRKLRARYQQDNKIYLCYNPNTGYIYYAGYQTYSCSQSATVPTRYYHDDYSLNLQDKKLVESIERIYDQLSESYLTTTRKYSYTNNHIYPVKVEQITTGGDVVVTEKRYVADYVINSVSDNNALGIHSLDSRNIKGAEIESVQYRQKSDGTNRRYISGSLTTYLPVQPYPEKIYQLELESPLTNFQFSAIANGVFSYSSYYKLSGSFVYNSLGNLVEQTKANDVTTSYVWGYESSYPVAQVIGVNSANANVGLTPSVLKNPVNDAALRQELNNIRINNPSALVTTYTFKPLVGVTTECDVNNRATFYEYDGLTRLINIKNNDGNIVKNNKYNYGTGGCITQSMQSLFYNAQVSQTFTKSDCSSGTPTTFSYTIPFGRYAATNQAAADALAQADLTANGQNYGNQSGQCLFYNDAQSAYFSKNNCPPEEGLGLFILYTVPAGKYNSAIDKNTANNMAMSDLQANGQTYANNYGTCSCSGEGKKMIGATCETGERHNDLSELQSNGQWSCRYFYVFSNGTTSGPYYEYSSSPCLID